MSISSAIMPNRFWYHTRHIPEEHLDFSEEMGRNVRVNGLCDVLEPANIERLRKYGVDTVELRLVWWELEPRPGVFDWSRFERDLERVERAGLRAGLMAWFNHPPAWYLQESERATCFTCLEHGLETTTLSPWDPETLRIKDRLYEMVANRYHDRLDFIYATFSGDYGEPVLPQGVRHYRFSPLHTHSGIFWTGDRYARASWHKYVRKRYLSIAALNEAWQTAFASWDDDLLCGITDCRSVNNRRRVDYLRWITESTADYARDVYAAIRRHFPNTRTGVPIGHCTESINGQLKSLCIKKLAQVDRRFTARWTGMAVLGEFGKSNVLACRVASAAHLYGVTYGEEAALMIDEDNAAAAWYEGLSNGMSMLHNDIGNIQRAGAISADMVEQVMIDPPRRTVAMFYPVEQEMIKAFDDDYEDYVNELFKSGGELRRKTDYDICDAGMIADGCLGDKSMLVFAVPCVITKTTLDALKMFQSVGGVIRCLDGAVVKLLESGEALSECLEDVRVLEDGASFEDYESLKESPHDYVTIHQRNVSRFDPEARTITITANTKET